MTRTKSDKGTIAIDFVHEALVCLAESNIDVVALLHEAGIASELLDSPQARVSSMHFGRLWHLIAQRLDDEFFGMDSHRMKAGSFTLLCHAIIHSDTLERALRRALRFLHLVIDDLRGELLIEGDTARIVVKDNSATPKRAFAYGTYLIMIHGLACWLIGRRIPLLRADFHCKEPPFSAEWRVLFSQALYFDQPYSGFTLSTAYLGMVNVQNERTMKEFLRSAPANFLVKYKNSDGLAAQIRRRLREIPPTSWPDFTTLAFQFHASTATLRRRLEEEGQSYRTILDDLRRDLAIDLLSESDQTIGDIARLLGFAEPSAFHRAFKKWTGNRPGEYRYAPKESAQDNSNA